MPLTQLILATTLGYSVHCFLGPWAGETRLGWTLFQVVHVKDTDP